MATTVDRVTLKTSVFKVSLSIIQGETFDKTVTWKAGSPASPVDLTGCTAAANLTDDEGTVLLSLTTGNGRIVLGGAAGTVQILIDKVTSADLDLLQGGKWEMKVTFADGSVRPLMAGGVAVKPR